MSPLAISASNDALADVRSRVLQVQQRIAAVTGQPATTPTGAATGASTSRTFASALSRAQAALGTGTASGAGAGAEAGAGAGGVTGDAIVADAAQYLGVPYRWGGTDPGTGLDCSGLVQRVMADNGISVPRTAAQQATAGTEVPSLAQARPGDLVVLEGGHHIGIYVGDGKMVHAPRTGDVVKVGTVFETPMTIRRLVPGAAQPAPTTALASSLRSSVLGGSTPATGAARYQSLFTAATAKYGLPPGLLSAVAATESGYDAGAVSPAGARGLMQLMPGTAADLGVDATDPAQAVDGAARLLSRHLDTFGSLPLALAAYNAGPGNVTRYGGVPPFAETQAYVRKVAAAMTRST